MNTKIIRFIAIASVAVLIVGTVFDANAKKRSNKVKPVKSIVQKIKNLETTPLSSYDD